MMGWKCYARHGSVSVEVFMRLNPARPCIFAWSVPEEKSRPRGSDRSPCLHPKEMLHCGFQTVWHFALVSVVADVMESISTSFLHYNRRFVWMIGNFQFRYKIAFMNLPKNFGHGSQKITRNNQQNIIENKRNITMIVNFKYS